jgi:CTP:molybdopterin cytidylyltransferase MocA
MAHRGEIDFRARLAAGAVEVSGAPRSAVAAVILAAGASSRMGSPKAFLDYRGETFLGRLTRMLRVYCESVFVVAGAPLEAPGTQVVVNPAPERGMLSSLQCGLAAAVAAGTKQAVAFTPVDYPAMEESTIEAIVARWSGELLRIPRHQGRRGHPVLIARPIISEILALPDGAQARDVVRRHETDIVYVDVNDPGILADVDTPADYERIR